MPCSASHVRVDLTTGEGLAQALEGVEVVIDASNAQRHSKTVLVNGTERLLKAEASAGVAHHVAISIVGCDQVPVGYYQAKSAQERLVETGPVPWSLQRATQFHSFLGELFEAAQRRRIRLTGAARLQPIDIAIVATRLADIAHNGPVGRLPDIAGPEVRTLTDLSRSYRRATQHRAIPVRMPLIGAAGRALRNGALCAPASATPTETFEDWIENTTRRKAA
jgi:hypothetical protein